MVDDPLDDAVTTALSAHLEHLNVSVFTFTSHPRAGCKAVSFRNLSECAGGRLGLANKKTARKSVRCEAAHIRAARFELIKTDADFSGIGPERETSHEASNKFCFRDYRSNRRRGRHAAVSFDRTVRQNRRYAFVAGTPHRGRRQQAPDRGV